MTLNQKPKVAAIIEARMTSSRLPGKVMLPILGKPVLELLVERVKIAKQIDEIIIATTTNPQDDVLESLAKKIGCQVYRGSENDVMSRVCEAAQKFGADIICEITGDCPLIDPEIVDQTVESFLANSVDYVSNCTGRVYANYGYKTYPTGIAVQVFSRNALEKSVAETQDPLDREHVTLYILRNWDFKLITLTAPESLKRPELRLTLDEQADFDLIKSVFESLYPKNPNFDLKETISFLDANPKIRELNAHIVQRSYTPPEIRHDK